jgi:hypothetical protein
LNEEQIQALRLVIGGDASGAVTALGQVNAAAGQQVTQASVLKRAWAEVAVALGAMALAAGVFLKKAQAAYMEYGSTIMQIQQKTQASAEAASTLAGEWKRFGVSSSQGLMAIRNLTMGIGKAEAGTKRYIQAFAAVGVTMDDLRTKNPAEIFAQVRDGLSLITDPAQRTAAAFTLLGRASNSMTSYLAKTPEQMKKVDEQLKKLGLVWGGKEIASFAELKGQMADMQLVFFAFQMSIVQAVMPAVMELLPVIKTLVDAFVRLPDPIKKVITWAVPLAAIAGVLYAKISGFVGTLNNLYAKLFQSATAWGTETAAVAANTAALEANALARIGVPGYSKGTGSWNNAQRAGDLTGGMGSANAQRQAKSFAQSRGMIVPTLGEIGRAEKSTGRLAATAAKAGGAFKAMGASIASAAVSMGPYIIAAAAAYAAMAGISWAYGEWRKAQAEAAAAHQQFADTVGSAIDKVGAKVGILSKKYNDFANLLREDVIADLNDHIEEGSKSFLGGPVWFHGTGDAEKVAAEKAKAILNATQKIFDAGPLSAEGKQKVVDAINALKGLGTVAAPAVSLLSHQLLAIDPHALDSAAQKAADLATQMQAAAEATKAAQDAYTTWSAEVAAGNPEYGTAFGQIGPSGAYQGGAVGQAYATAMAGAKQRAEEAASAGQQAAQSLAKIPDNILQALNRDWARIGERVKQSMEAFFSAWEGYTDDMVVTANTRLGNLAGIAQSLATVLTSIADAPKKALQPVKQNWTALGQYVRSAMNSLINVFIDLDNEMAATRAERAGSIASMAGALGSFLQGIADMPKKHLAPTRQNWTALGQTLKMAILQILKVFADVGKIGKQSERAGSIASMAGSLGTFLQALNDMPDKMVKVTPQKWQRLAAIVKQAVNAILSVFASLGDKALGKQAGRAGTVAGMAGSLGTFIGALADMPDTAIVVIPQKWAQLGRVIKSAVNEVLRVYEEITTKILTKKAARMDLIASLVGPLATIIDFFKNAPTTAVGAIRQNWGQFGYVIQTAVEEILVQFKTWDEKVLKMRSGKMGLIGSMTSVVADILSLATSIPEAMNKLLGFGDTDYAAIFKDVGQKMVEIIRALTTAFDRIPKAADLAKAENAVSTLTRIFGKMSELSVAIAPPEAAAAGTGATPQLPDASRVQAAAAGGGVQVTINIKNLNGTDHAAAKSLAAQVARILQHNAQMRTRTAY